MQQGLIPERQPEEFTDMRSDPNHRTGDDDLFAGGHGGDAIDVTDDLVADLRRAAGETSLRVAPDVRHVHKGRGAVSNREGRFESQSRVEIDDGWGSLEDLPAKPARQEIVDATRRVITRNQSPDVPFDRSINAYRGCEHGCIYCFARPTHAWLGMSPGLDFETRITYKPDAAICLVNELAKPAYSNNPTRPVAPINMGTNTDPYQPIESTRRITRQLLEVLSDCNHPVGITTKGTLIERDLDILASMASRNLVHVSISLPTLDHELSRTLEPRAAAPRRRLKTLRLIAQAGIPVSLLMAPVIPLLTDGEIEKLLKLAAQAGAESAGYVLLRLPLEVRDLFVEWLQVHHPDKASHVMQLVRDTRGGRDYQSAWGVRQRGTGDYADLIAQRFAAGRRRYGLNTRQSRLDCSQFVPPVAAGATTRQLGLFDGATG